MYAMSTAPGTGQTGDGRAGDQRTEAGRTFWSGYDELWGLTEPPTPRRGTGLDRSAIVRAAIGIADAEGLDGVTMRRVADRLNTGPMSLYRYVPDKDALVSMMIDAVIGDLDGSAPAVPADWRTAMRWLAESTWQVCRTHRWYPEATLIRPPLTPNGIAGLELGLSIFDGYDLAIATKAHFVGAVHFGVLSAALNLAIEERARERMHLSEADVMAASTPFMRRMMDSGAYPRVTEFITRAEHVDERTQMLAGVELILDGIASRLPPRSPAGPS
jgi:AcrR family transcriptional regulator